MLDPLVVHSDLRSPVNLASLFVLLYEKVVAEVFTEAVSVVDLRDTKQVAPSRASHVFLEAELLEIWFKKAAGLFKVLNAGVVCEELAHVIVAFKKAPRHYFKYRQNCSLIEILYERLSLLRDG